MQTASIPCIVNQFLRSNTELFASAGTQCVHDQQNQITVRNFLNTERSKMEKNAFEDEPNPSCFHLSHAVT
jgi:hypothetical protein